MFINSTGVIAQIMESGTQNLTGGIIATLFMILLFLILVAMMFQIPLEYLAVLILPFCLAVGAYYSTFIIPITIIILYLSSILAKNWIYK